MPTYQYRCTECGNELEAVQRFTDPSLTECPSCEGQLRKVFNAVGVVFKGSGFYRTDSRTDAKKSAGSTSAEAGSTSGDKGTGEKSSAEKKSGDSSSTEKPVSKQPVAAGSSSGSGGDSGNSGKRSSTAA